MSIKESGEMYLETIYILSQQEGEVRSMDVASYMNFSRPSVSRGVGLLKKSGHVTADKDGYLKLTDKGLKLAKKVYERHVVLSDLLERIGVEPETAAADACKIEHVISDESFDALKRYVAQIEK